MTSDIQIRDDIEAELDWDARVDSRQIAVAVQDGIATLTGHVSSYTQRHAAEKAAQSVAGVKAVANDIKIDLPFDGKRTDAEIAQGAIDALAMNVSVPANTIKIAVHDGWITLEGQVPTWYQKTVAEDALIHMRGVRGISNQITVRAQPAVRDVERKITAALHRRAQLDANSIHVTAKDGTVTLEGEVDSWSQRSEAEFAAWQAPGVAKVVDNLTVR